MVTLHIHLDQMQIAEHVFHCIEDSSLACADWSFDSQRQLAFEIADALSRFIEVRRDAARAN